MSNNLNVKVPATSANMGPGFDCLGMALNIWNSVSILDRSDDTTKVISGVVFDASISKSGAA